ncbi:MAG: hypothetical protein DI596_03175, partial [Azospira oryzae]
MAKMNAFYAQSGGVTAVINTSACAVIETARKHKDKIGKVYAGRDGIIGALTEDLIDTSKEPASNIAGLRYTPGVIPESRGAGASRFDLFKIRGFDAVNYLNGLRMQKMNWVSPQVDPYMLERVEVLRG